MANTLLCVDDHGGLPADVAGRLEAEGLEAVHVEDPEEALARVRAGEADVVLLEPLLSTGDGLELMEDLCVLCGQARPPVPVLVATRGGRTPALYGRAVELGVAEFLSRPTAAQLVAAVRAAVRERDEPPEEETEAAGELSDLVVSELLHRLHGRGYTGVLVLRRGEESVGVQLRNGSPVAVSSGGRREPLEDFLLRTGRIDRGQHERLVDQLFAGLGSPEEILTGMDALGEEQVAAALREHAEEPLLQVFGWTSGSYRLLPGRRLKASSALEVQRDATALLFEGVVRHAPAEQVRRELERRGALYATAAEGSDELARGVGLTRLQREVLGRLGGERSLAEVVASGELQDRLLYALVLLGAVELQLEPVLLLLEEVPEADAAPPEASPGEAPEASAAGAASPDRAGADAPDEAAGAADRERRRNEAELSALAGVLADQDDFAVLGVDEEASDEQVRRAYETRLQDLGVAVVPPEEPRLAQLTAQIRARIDRAYEHLAETDSRRSYAAALREEAKARAAREQALRALEAERWFRKGERLLQGKRHQEAVEALGMAAHLDPDEGEYVSWLGYALYLSNAGEEVVRREAMEQIARGIKLSPDRPMPYVFLGRLFRATDDVEHARRMFQRATRIDPDFHPALQELRLLELRQDKARGLLGRLRRR